MGEVDHSQIIIIKQKLSQERDIQQKLRLSRIEAGNDLTKKEKKKLKMNQENINFDQYKEYKVNQYLEANKNKFNPYALADLNRLDINNYLIKPITSIDIKETIRNFKNKAPGISGINKEILINMSENTYQILERILNYSLSMGYFPKKFKIALMIFIHKEGKDPTRVENYRPISLLEVPGKIFEKILTNRLTKYLETNNKLNKNQYGFRKGRGTTTALATFHEIIAISQQKGEQCIVALRDIKKAFDKIWHQGLTYKLIQLNLEEIFTKVICSFLHNRKAQLKIDNYIGNSFELLSGVPQGSILSPLLFIFFTADMPEAGAGCYSIIFADDNTQIITYPSQSKNMMSRRAEREINTVNNYEKTWKIQTSIEKFKLISISKSKAAEIKINGNIIPYADTGKILGLTISRTGISSHLNNKIKQANNTLARLKRFKKLKPETNLYLIKQK